MILIQAVQANAVRPFPVILAFGINDAAIRKSEEEFARRICYVHKVVNKKLDCGVDYSR